jgi:hypothetical protein
MVVRETGLFGAGWYAQITDVVSRVNIYGLDVAYYRLHQCIYEEKYLLIEPEGYDALLGSGALMCAER